jgi:hypothetical protein
MPPPNSRSKQAKAREAAHRKAQAADSDACESSEDEKKLQDAPIADLLDASDVRDEKNQPDDPPAETPPRLEILMIDGHEYIGPVREILSRSGV